MNASTLSLYVALATVLPLAGCAASGDDDALTPQADTFGSGDAGSDGDDGPDASAGDDDRPDDPSDDDGPGAGEDAGGSDDGDGDAGGSDDGDGDGDGDGDDADPDDDGGDGDGGSDDGDGDGDGDGGSTGDDGGSTDDGELPDYDDGDSPSEPAVFTQFRATSPAPVWIDTPLFNAEPIDTRGVQYIEQIDGATDPADHLQFRIVPGEVDPTIQVSMECDVASMRADIIDPDGDVIGSALCGAGEQSVLLQGAGSMQLYRVHVHDGAASLGLTDYVLSVDAFCFQSCSYGPYDG